MLVVLPNKFTVDNQTAVWNCRTSVFRRSLKRFGCLFLAAVDGLESIQPWTHHTSPPSALLWATNINYFDATERSFMVQRLLRPTDIIHCHWAYTFSAPASQNTWLFGFSGFKKKWTVWLLLVLFMPLFNLSTWSVISPHNVSLFTPVFHQQINVSFTTQRYIIHLSWPDTSLMFLLSLVVCIGLFVVRMGTLAVYRPRPDPQRAQGTSCVVSFTVKGNSASAAFQLKTMSCWMWCCGIWTENSRRSD